MPKNAKLIQAARSKHHYYTNNAVFYKDDKGNFHLLEHLTYDYTSILNPYFCLWHHFDKKEVYYKQFKIKDVDFDTFQVLFGKIAKDKNRVYFGKQPIKEADTSTFQLLFNSYDNDIFVGKDKNFIFLPDFEQPKKLLQSEQILKPVKNIDASSFEFAGRFWARDGKTVFCKFKPMPEIDIKSFQTLFSDGTNEWAKDKNHLYNANGIKTFKDVDGATFMNFNQFWGKDKHSIFSFFTESIINTADVKSFKTIGFEGMARDKHFDYKIDTIHHKISKTKRIQ